MAQTTSSALRALALEYKSLQEEPVEGFRVKLVNEDNMFEWEVAIFGPPDTLYQGGYFKVIIRIILSFCSFWKLGRAKNSVISILFPCKHHSRGAYFSFCWLCFLLSLSTSASLNVLFAFDIVFDCSNH